MYHVTVADGGLCRNGGWHRRQSRQGSMGAWRCVIVGIGTGHAAVVHRVLLGAAGRE